MSDALQQTINTLTQLKRMHQLTYELLEELNVTSQWILDNKINIPNENQLRSLLGKSLTLLTEIQADEPIILQYNINRRKVTDFREDNKTDEEVTEPIDR